MITPSNRAPLLLSLVILLGVGGRWLRGEQAPPKDPPVAGAGLDSQLARVERARTGTGGRSDRSTSRSARGRAEGRGRGAGSSSKGGDVKRSPRGGRKEARTDEALALAASPVRSERTPIGAVAPEAMARYRADQERVGDGGGRSTRARQPARRARRGGANEDASGARERSLVDLETAPAAELERLPRVGPALARRIVEDRRKHGPFRSLEGLQRVRGIGPGLARQLQGYVTFEGTGRP